MSALGSLRIMKLMEDIILVRERIFVTVSRREIFQHGTDVSGLDEAGFFRRMKLKSYTLMVMRRMFVCIMKLVLSLSLIKIQRCAIQMRPPLLATLT